ncbi:MAG: hypothetical protein IT330_04490 [Anaerolineae bacterium]|nr:hypothetical protein [Anaerolineae bacterium]
MSEQSSERWETHLQAAARAFPYPPTPDMAGAVTRRLSIRGARPAAPHPRWAWAAIAIAFIVIGLLAVPQVRATVVEFLRVGVVRIFLTQPTPAATRLPGGQTGTPPLVSVLDLVGETTLADAEVRFGSPIRLPTYPSDLGPPDRVFFQDMGGPMIVLAWLDRERPERARLSLHLLSPEVFAEKIRPQIVQETTVHDARALWTEGPHLLQFRRGNATFYDNRRLVQGNTLIWTDGGLTYRLETDLPLAEAVRIAESLR